MMISVRLWVSSFVGGFTFVSSLILESKAMESVSDKVSTDWYIH